jgi:transcriptional regulator with AAA-type ATPase domain
MVVVTSRRRIRPTGLRGTQRDLVSHTAGRLATLPGPAGGAGAEAAQNAIRDYQRPSRLQDNQLAVGSTPRERVASARALIDQAIDDLFGHTHEEQALRAVLRAAYVEPNGGHERAAYDLNMSRSTYFRKLRTAVDRVTNHLAQ